MSSEIELHDGYIAGQYIEFRSYYLPDGHSQYQYRGTFNEAMNEMSGTYKGIAGTETTGLFTATKDSF